MAIVKMLKISFFGLASQRDAALSYLMKKGVMQIDDATALLEEEEISSLVSKDVQKDQARKYERRKNAAFSAMTGLKQLTGFKKGLFAQKHERAKPTYDEARDIYRQAKKVNAGFHELDNLKARQTSLENEIEALSPWRNFDGDLGAAETKTVRALLGTLPKAVTEEAVLAALEEQAPFAVYVEAGRDEAAAYGALYAHKSCFDEAVKAARALGFSPAAFQNFSGTGAENISRCEREI